MTLQIAIVSPDAIVLAGTRPEERPERRPGLLAMLGVFALGLVLGLIEAMRISWRLR
jgi:hypothetical protein